MAKDTNKDAVAVSEKTVTEPATKPATPKDAGAAPKKNEVKQKVEKADTKVKKPTVEGATSIDGFALVNHDARLNIANELDLPWSYYPTHTTPVTVDINSLLTLKVLTEKEAAVLETPFVLIDNIAIEPVKVGISYAYGAPWQADYDQGFGGQVTEMANGLGDFSMYKVVVQGRKMFLLLDKDSKMIIRTGHDSSRPHEYWSARHMPPATHVVLKNSDSTDDVFIGNCMLENVSSKENILNETTLRASRLKQGYQYHYPFEPRGGSDEKKPAVFLQKDRHEYAKLRIRDSRVTNSILPESAVFKSTISNTTIEGDRWSTITDSNISDTTLRGLNVTVNKASITSCSIATDAQLTHGPFWSRDVSLNANGALLLNKFCLMRTPIPQDDITFVRVADHEYEVFIYASNSKRLPSDATREQVEEAINVIMPGRDYRSGVTTSPANPLRDSVMKYVVDSIMSRLEVINTLDTACEYARDLNKIYPQHEDVFRAL